MAVEARINKRLGKSFHLNADFRCDDGCLGILGASGSGKSMLLKCIAGIETPDHGRIVVNGRVLFDDAMGVNVKPQQRRVGYLFQNYALFPNMTVEKNIGIGVTRPQTEKAALVRELLHTFHLDGLEDRYPPQLSGGQQQRAALARMLAAKPEVILLDEPFSALDAHLREQMQLRLLEILRGHRDAVMVTHNRDEAFKLCTDVMVLDNGAVLGSGKTRELFANPGHVTIATLTGCKNISRIEPLSPTAVRAIDWGLTLRSALAVPPGASHVGIRAHDFEPLRNPGGAMNNVVEMRVRRRAEDLFEWNVIFTNAAQAETAESGEIWWKYSKYALDEFPTHLRLPPEALLFLHDE